MIMMILLQLYKNLVKILHRYSSEWTASYKTYKTVYIYIKDSGVKTHAHIHKLQKKCI